MIAGPSSLVLTDVLAPHETLMDVLMDTHQHPLGRENAALSQPYYQLVYRLRQETYRT